MEYKELVKIISTKKYRQKELSLNSVKMSQLINVANQMQINEEAFKIIRILIRYFRFPILILFRKFYDRLDRQKKILAFNDDLMKTGSLVMSILENKDYPSLKFYTRAGFKEGPEQPKNIGQPKEFKDFIFDIDNKLNRIVGDKSKYELDQLKFTLAQLSDFRKANRFQPIFDFCVQAYVEMANLRKKQIESLLQHRLEKIQDQRNKRQLQKIYIEQGSTIKEISDNRVSQDYLCCRPYFYQNQIINEPQTITQQYKHYTYPYNKFLNEILLKTIVGFLNGRGGIIYIGIRENNDTKKRLIRGETYNQSLKEDVLKHFRQLGQRVAPEIVNNQLYKLEYVPIRDESGFLAGQYIIRLRISKGQKDELYSFRNYDSQQLIAFRTANEVLQRKLGQQILELYRQKLTQPEQPQESNHPGTCKKPQLGRPLYENSKPSSNNYHQSQPRWINKKPQNNFRQKSPQYSILAYLFTGKEIITDLKPYYHQKYKRLPVIEPANGEQDNIVKLLIETSNDKSQYIPISLKLTFEEQYFHSIESKLSQCNVMMRTQKSSRTMLIFNVVKEAVYAADILTKLGVPFRFASK